MMSVQKHLSESGGFFYLTPVPSPGRRGEEFILGLDFKLILSDYLQGCHLSSIDPLRLRGENF